LVQLDGGGQEGKLTGAVDHWWGGDGGANDDLLADLQAYGADASCLPESVTKPKQFEVWPEHEDAVMLFLQCQTQWRVGGSGVIGLDYGVVLQMMDLYAVGNRRQALEDLQIMESRAKELINRAAEPKQAKPLKGRRR
jgi:hypothetical protein